MFHSGRKSPLAACSNPRVEAEIAFVLGRDVDQAMPTTTDILLWYRMIIWPVSSPPVANKAQAKLYAALRRDGSTQAVLPEMQTRTELYDMIGLHEYEALDASIVATMLPS